MPYQQLRNLASKDLKSSIKLDYKQTNKDK